jgi:di/tricarboxylate transporter
MPPLPDQHALAVLVLTVFALFLFTRERIPLETSCLVVLVLLTIGFEWFPYHDGTQTLHTVDFFSGFGHEALVAVCGLMVVGHGLVRTGALEPVGRLLARLWLHSPQLSLLLTLVVAGLLSAFVNNTPVVVLLLPILVSTSLRAGTSASGILMPMGLSTLVGGMATTIGTSTNLLVVSVAADLGLPRFGMFDFFVPAMIAGSLGILYLWLVAPRILPERQATLADTSPRIFSAQLNITEQSAADGRTLAELFEKTGSEMKVQRIQRGESVLLPLPDVTIRAGDQLILEDTPAQLKEFEHVLGATLYSGESAVDEDHPLQAQDQQLAEIVVVQGSPLLNRTLNASRFTDRYQLVSLALQQAGTGCTRTAGKYQARRRTAGAGCDCRPAFNKECASGIADHGSGHCQCRNRSAANCGQRRGRCLADAVVRRPGMARCRQCPEHRSHHDRGGQSCTGHGTDQDRCNRLAGGTLSRRDCRAGTYDSPQRSDSADGRIDQYHLQQCSSGDRYTGSHFDRQRAGATGRGLCTCRPVRRQHELRDTHGLQDQPAGDERRWLYLR